LYSVADTPDEQNLSREAVRLADRELDQAFASALREASAAPLPSSGPLKQLSDKIAEIKARIAAAQQRIVGLTKAAETKEAAARELDVAKAALALDEDELEDAKQDLARQGGDRYGNLQRALQEHEADQQHAPGPPKLVTGEPGTLAQQIALWSSLRDRERQIQAAVQQASQKSTRLKRVHDTLEKLVTHAPGDADVEASPAMLARLRQLSDQRKTLAELDKRIQDARELAAVYSRWIAVVEARRVQALHLVLWSLSLVLAILMVTILIDRGIRRAFARLSDPRRLHQLRVMATIAVQLVAGGLILLTIFGPPNQISTILGLATAGLTIVLKDFIVAFFGWFALMGKNGIRVGDWVQIGGVSGEVIEIGVFRTILLEMGNWTYAGHPTGRHVAMMNSFAIEGQYFNFSTSGQWLWDEVQATLPASVDPYRAAQQIRELVERETEADSVAAEQEWARVTQKYKTRTFSAKPAVEFRTSNKGLDVAVRYITRAPQRFEMRARLLHAIVDVLQAASKTTG
jgi:small-conductance mechanosensitive channel